MIRFDNDYTEGAHPFILEELVKTNTVQLPGYGEDEYCRLAAEHIKRHCANEDVDVHFMVGGTQANTTIISAILRPHQAVLAADSGHIAVHETGAIESTGHKVLELQNTEGKINADQIASYVQNHWDDPTHEHIPQPKLVYLSQPTELGTLYTKAELQAIRDVCLAKNLYLMVDGARLGYGMAAKTNDVTLHDLTTLTDIFYIGGTKVGAMFGEAIVISHDYIKEDFRYIMKQRGGMLAKGRFLGLQFKVLFEDNLYFDVSNHAIRMAELLLAAFKDKGIALKYDSPTNQIFPILEDDKIKELHDHYSFYVWEEAGDGRKAVRICTSWSTKEEDINSFIAAL
ncbi:aminotransferase class I/II-fold pyridoxal phosphate-dependent enzyme [Macrococcus equipercicus]|uniref:Aminotransferase class I/II-fold pyridoxal phosphate-dependent enzyme n=1 Tax=Macrococcus equipercicus TaxID=69967 RepID=A0ABQ6R6W0_9STAP|nr:aminotransferase class I/II-fold pyridoxal phosphate-dependent enzyme [Macrococcus equipercicus]KAA1037597.1 aminotransferase class I/II-fold pyridoxal phosphate-dependent enzyme [Macrococcus equipercicus]